MMRGEKSLEELATARARADNGSTQAPLRDSIITPPDQPRHERTADRHVNEYTFLSAGQSSLTGRVSSGIRRTRDRNLHSSRSKGCSLRMIADAVSPGDTSRRGTNARPAP
jgi:hypothetical protein